MTEVSNDWLYSGTNVDNGSDVNIPVQPKRRNPRANRGLTKNHSRWGGRRRKDQRRKDSDARNAEWRKMPPEQQLKWLDMNHGVGVGAQRQRTRIQKQIEYLKLLPKLSPIANSDTKNNKLTQEQKAAKRAEHEKKLAEHLSKKQR